MKHTDYLEHDIHNRLTNYIGTHDYTKCKVAAAIKKGRQYLYQNQDASVVTAGVLIRLAKNYNINPMYILGLSDQEKWKDEKKK